MQKQLIYQSVHFPVHVMAKAIETMLAGEKPGPIIALSVTLNNGEQWSFDTVDEFLAGYSHHTKFHVDLWSMHNDSTTRLFMMWPTDTHLAISVTGGDRQYIESVFDVFHRYLQESKVEVESTPVTVFIGHGRNAQWRILKDHLADQHGFRVIAYEKEPRAGITTQNVLESMIDESDFAILILTGEDIDANGEAHARENVIHELGLFQGCLGFRRAIIVLEDGCHEFSNIVGLNQIRFSKGNIREAFGDIVATIDRELDEG